MSESTTPSIVEPLWDLPPDSPLKVEWELFRRERPRLLTEGHEGRWVLIKREEIVGVFDTRDQAVAAGYQRFGVVPLLAQQILWKYKPLRQGFFGRCRP